MTSAVKQLPGSVTELTPSPSHEYSYKYKMLGKMVSICTSRENTNAPMSAPFCTTFRQLKILNEKHNFLKFSDCYDLSVGEERELGKNVT